MTTTSTLADLCDLVALQVDPASIDPGLPYLGLEHLAPGRMVAMTHGHAGDVQSHKFAFCRGDVLYGKLRPYLDKAVLAEHDGVCTTELLVLRPKPGIDRRYLACLVHAPGIIEHAMSGVTGAHHPRTSWSHVSRYPVLPLEEPEQKAVAAFMWRLHDAIAASEHGEHVATRLKQAAMRDLFSRGLSGEPQKETEIGPIPASWDLIDFASAREWLQYGTSMHCTLEPVGYPVLRIPNVGSGSVNTTELKYCDVPAEEAAKYLLGDGDLLFIRTNGVLDRLGSCAVYSGIPERALFASYLIRARLKSVAEPKFVAYFYGSERGTGLVAGRATPAADGKYNLNTGTIDSLPLPLPKTREEQQEIVVVLDAIDRKIDLHRRKKAVLEELFKSLLHKLMTGEVRVADLDLSALPAPEEARS